MNPHRRIAMQPLNKEGMPHEEVRRLAEAVRDACLKAAREGYEQGGMSGLCQEGAWECAVGAIQTLDVEAILHEQEQIRDGA